jgi:hypothetical protein
MQNLNDDAIGYNMILLGASAIGATIAALIMAPIFAGLTVFANGILASGSLYVSAQTMNTVGFIIGLGVMLPIFLLIGFVVKAYVLATYEKENGRSGLI